MSAPSQTPSGIDDLLRGGARLREATNLRVANGDRRQIRINCGKGSKQRIVPASPRLLNELRAYWKQGRPSNYLFPGKTPDTPLSSTTIQKACKLAVAKANPMEPTPQPLEEPPVQATKTGSSKE